jgi:hypothetical protein
LKARLTIRNLVAIGAIVATSLFLFFPARPGYVKLQIRDELAYHFTQAMARAGQLEYRVGDAHDVELKLYSSHDNSSWERCADLAASAQFVTISIPRRCRPDHDFLKLVAVDLDGAGPEWIEFRIT